ncbi:MAG: rhamnogalacturonan acetylesterase [Bacteroidaceae bacterium]|nr:rhamnogalacturonan acetylesterase [Bacteroidaceae bacterium]
MSDSYAQAQSASWHFKLTGEKVQGADRIQVTPADRFGKSSDYGYDFISAPSKMDEGKTAFFSVRVPDGNYRVTMTVGSSKRAAETTIRAESRRLMAENIATRKGEHKTLTFVVNKHTPEIDSEHKVHIKQRERTKLNWDDRLTIEINGLAPAVATIDIEPDTTATTIFLCGNSTVVDQDFEPWASWGQMIPRWFNQDVCIANFGESGESASTFIQAGRLAKALSMMRPGDYLIAEFGHNDQKQKSPGAGAYYNFATALKTFIDETKARGGHIIFITPTQRRSFAEGKIRETHGDYPDAMRWVASREKIPVIELHDMTRTLFETFGEEGSKKCLVHYPANTFPGQVKPLADNTHFNPFGAYEVAKCVIEGMRMHRFPFVKALRKDYVTFSPAAPDDPSTFKWAQSPMYEGLKPDGN